MTRIHQALISVSDKAGVTDFARRLSASGIEIMSTGGTAQTLREGAVEVQDVSAYTGFPEIMSGRVKTLHPHVHAGLLARRGIDDAALAEHGMRTIDLLAVNLYPFRETVAQPDCTPEHALEQIDIGGPAMLRAAAKNFTAVTVVVDPADYAQVATEIEASGGVSQGTRLALAQKAFRHTAEYDRAVAEYLGRLRDVGPEPQAEQLNLVMLKSRNLRYGENPHQRAALYLESSPTGACAATARMLQGKELSFNNIADADAALDCVRQFESPACVIVKHANPCGVAVDDNIVAAYKRAYRADPKSAFGGIIAFNRTLSAEAAEEIAGRQFVELIIAPEVEQAALEALARKPKIRVLACGSWHGAPEPSLDYRRVRSGLLVQDRDDAGIVPGQLEVVTRRPPSEHELSDLLFAWKVVKYVKSNAIVYAKDGMTVGIGAGQMSRVYSARIAALKAADDGLAIKGSVMASDAFFPFRDSIEDAAEQGVHAVVQPGGSRRDEEVIAAADEHGIAMVFTGLRHFRH